MNITYTVVSRQGRREEMQDAHCLVHPFNDSDTKLFAAVFDGHMQHTSVAFYAAKRLPVSFKKNLIGTVTPCQAFTSSFADVDESLPEKRGGACALAVYINGTRVSYAHVGDCGLFISPQDGGARMVTRPHRLGNPDEEQRISPHAFEKGAFFEGNMICFPNNEMLQPLRAIGDHDFREFGIISTPECGTLEVDSGTFLVLGTDGLFDRVPRHQIEGAANFAVHTKAVAQELDRLVIENGPRDNFTFIVILLKL